MIKIINDFFEDEMFLNVQNHITTKIYYTPRYFEEREKNKDSYYGSRFLLSEDKNLLNTFIKQAEKNLK